MSDQSSVTERLDAIERQLTVIERAIEILAGAINEIQEEENQRVQRTLEWRRSRHGEE